MVPVRVNLGENFHFGIWATKKDNGELGEEEKALIWFGKKGHTDRVTALSVRPNMWHHFCISFNFLTGGVLAMETGNMIVNQTISTPLVNISESFNPNSSSICVMSNHRYEMRMMGMLTDFNMFGKALNEQEMVNFTSCKNYTPGDTVSWESAIWKTKGVTTTNESLENICKPPEQYLVLPRSNHPAARKHCGAIGGKMIGSKTKNVIEQLGMKSDCLKAAKVWTGLRYKGHFGNLHLHILFSFL